jgi:hypothetical protein
MTELLDANRLRLLARDTDQPAETARRLVPVLKWTVDEETGRPVSRWVLQEASDGCL